MKIFKKSFQRIKCQASVENQKKMVLKDSENLIIHIKATFNNTLLTLVNSQGQVLTWVSAGSCGFKGTRKGTPFAAKKVVEIFLKKSYDFLVRCHQIKICVCGVGLGRESALRDLTRSLRENLQQEKKKTNKKNNKITLIREVTKLPHNGCRPPKKRRL